jgi:hypothetical protein
MRFILALALVAGATADAIAGGGGNRKKGRVEARLYCMVPGVWTPKFAARVQEIDRSWGARCDVLRYFVDPTPAALPANVISVSMARVPGEPTCPDNKPCRHIWEKVWRSWLWVATHELHLAEWFAKVDDDTFLFPENLRWFVQHRRMDSAERHYFGQQLFHTPKPIISGVATFFSRATIKALGEVYSTMPRKPVLHGTKGHRAGYSCEDRAGATEEISTAICLFGVGITPTAVRDDSQKELVLIDSPDNMLLWKKLRWWYWQGKPEWVRDGADSLSDRPFAFHKYKGAGQLEYMNGVLYGDGKALRQYDHAVGRKSHCKGPKAKERCGNLTLTKRYLRQVRHRLLGRVGERAARQGASQAAAPAVVGGGTAPQRADLAARVTRLETLVAKLQAAQTRK